MTVDPVAHKAGRDGKQHFAVNLTGRHQRLQPVFIGIIANFHAQAFLNRIPLVIQAMQDRIDGLLGSGSGSGCLGSRVVADGGGGDGGVLGGDHVETILR